MLRFIPSFISIPLTSGTYIIERVPFFSQQIDKRNYQTEGFATVEQGYHWTPRISGIVCLKMAIAYYQGRVVPLRELLDYGMRINAYREDVGWIHSGLVRIARHYGINAKQMSIGGHINHIARHIMAGHLVMASVAGGFEWGNGGHLVVVYGVYVENHRVSRFLVHHSGTIPEHEFPEHWVDRERFVKSFSRAGNVVILTNK